MEVFIILALSHLVTAEYPQNHAHLEERKWSLKKKFRPLYHVSSPVGWLNSVSGFTYYNKRYHLFYQYHPYNGAWGSMHWGHVASDNLIDWAHYPPALIPKDIYDKNGCLSGSVAAYKNYLTLFYTGYVLASNKTFYTQNVAVSSDGVMFQKYLHNPVLRQPPRHITEFRNPRVWRFRNKWFMMVGGSSDQGHGQLILYTSIDMFHWKYNSTLAQSYGDMGQMWENPDFFVMDNYHVLILSIYGIQGDIYRFKNVYQTGYVVGNFNYRTLKFENMEVSLSTFCELDYGHDFYAAQTMQSVDGRRLLVAWLGTWETDVVESKDGWANMLTIMREVNLSPRGRLLVTPAKELTELRTEILENAWYSPGESFHAGAKAFELVVNGSSVVYDAAIIFEWNGDGEYTIAYRADRGLVSVDRGGVDGVRKADWAPRGQLYWRIFVDSSSIEVFCGEGEVVFSSRIYPKRGLRIRVGGELQLQIAQYRLRKSVRHDKKLREYLKRHIMNNAST